MAATRKPLYLDASFGAPTEVSSADALQAGLFTAVGVGGVALNANGNLLSNLADPVNAQDAVTKKYADAISQGITQIPSVRVLANSNQALSGLPTIDGVQLIAGDRVLLVAQTNAVTNGVWAVASGSWSRPAGGNGVSDWTTGRNASSLAMFVREGQNFADEGYTCITDGAPKIDTDPVTFTQYTGLGEVTAGAGLVKQTASGNTIAINIAGSSGLQFTGNALDTLLDPAGALSKSAAGLAVKLSINNTLAEDASGLRVLGLPTLFTVAGSATQATVSASALNTLTAGSSSYADSLHQHTNVLQSQAVVGTYTNGSAPLAAGDPVQWSSTADTLQRCDAAQGSTSLCIGVALTAIAANASGPILRRGIATSVLTQATPGTAWYLNVGGGLVSSVPTQAGSSVVRVGLAKNASDLEVNPVLLSVRSAS